MGSLLESLGIEPRFLFTIAVGFVILFLVLKKFAFGPIFNMLQARQDNIRHNLDEAQSRRDEMVRLQHEYEDRLAKIEDEARDKIQAAVKDAQAARDEILQRAQVDAQTIVQRGHADIERQRQQAMVEMRNQVADLAIQAATLVVHSHLNAGNHSALIDEVIAGVGQPGAGASSAGASSNGTASTRNGGLA
ncbi:MAG TPA: F0F1 ATP synthase subunit B [Abditibacteriaceae bacterium]|jgi:F-type H+-transporting ATPase subunit b